jgi:DNA-binding transcriptional MerR regulator
MYDQHHVRRLTFIRQSRELGFSLHGIRTLLAGSVKLMRTRKRSARSELRQAAQLTPLGQGGKTVLFEDVAAVEVTVVVEVVVD